MSQSSGFLNQCSLAMIQYWKYTREFLMIHERTTPKNNLLKWSALLLAKSLTDIEDIEKRLKCTNGDSKLLPKKKPSQVQNVCELWKTRHKEKLVNVLSKIINTKKDLQQLAKNTTLGQDYTESVISRFLGDIQVDISTVYLSGTEGPCQKNYLSKERKVRKNVFLILNNKYNLQKSDW